MSKVLDLENALPAIKTWIWSHFQSLKGGTSIAANTDLNTIMDVGNYYCALTDKARTLSNTPIAAANMAAFTMKVGYSNGAGYTYQELIIYNTGVRYYRCNTTTSDTSKWQAWQAFEKNSNTYTSAYCGTGAGTAAKTATCTNYVLKANSYLHITMTASNTAASALTLNVNGKGAKPIWINGSPSSASNHTLPSGTYIVFYDGTKYYFNTEHGITDHLLPKGFAKNRRTTANIPSDNSAGVETFLATSAMTEGKPLGGDGYILHFNWDSGGRWASQLAIHNGAGTIETRYQGPNSGADWTEWRKAAMFNDGVTPESGKALVTDGNKGRIKTVDMAGAVEGDPTSLKRRGAIVGQTSNGGLSKPWYKVATVAITAKAIDREIIFLVEDTMAGSGNTKYEAGRIGILKVRCRTNEVDQFTYNPDATYLTWLTNSGYFSRDFALAVKVTAGTKVEYELWTRCIYNYSYRRFIVLSEGDRNHKETEDWTLLTNYSDGSQASLPTGYSYIYSNVSPQSAQTLTNENLNDLKFANDTSYGVAHFYAAGSNSVTNTPFSTRMPFGLELRKTAANICVQEIWRSDSAERYFRFIDGGASPSNWSDWTKIATNDGDYAKQFYAVCGTAAGTVAKTVTINGFGELFEGVAVNLKMTNSNSASNPTLNVNGTGAKPIVRYGTTAAGNNANTSWDAGGVYSFVYDGTSWVMLDFAHRGNDNTYTSAYCSTAAATAAKAATCTNYALLTNSYLHVTMTNANTYNGAITLNVNGKGAKPIWINGAASSSSNKTLPAGTYLVFYDGSKYMFRTDGKIDGVTAAAGTNDKTLATTAFVKKACDDATDAVVGDHLIYKVGTCVHTRENVPPSTVGTWVRTYRLDRWGYDPAYYNDEYNVGSAIEMAFSWYQVSSTNGEGLVGYFNIPGLGESGATVDDVGLSIDFGSSGEFIDVFYNGVRYRAKENTGDINRFHIRGISGDTLFFDLAGLKMTTDTSGTGTVLPDKSSGTGRIKGVGFRCSKPLYHWTRVS